MDSQKNMKALLWRNTLAIMRWRYGRENLARLARDCGFGAATASRIKEQQTEVQLQTLEALARRFGFEPWQLLTEGFDPASPPQLQASRLPADEIELLSGYRQLSLRERDVVLDRVSTMRALNEQEAAVSSRTLRKRAA